VGYVEDIRALVGQKPLILVGAVALVIDEDDRVLLQQRKHPLGRWAFPGGLMELGESTEETVRREVKEETSITLEALWLLGVYSGRNHYLVAANGDPYYVVTTAYVCRAFTGTICIHDHESLDLGFFAPETVSSGLVESHRIIWEDYRRTALDGVPPGIYTAL